LAILHPVATGRTHDETGTTLAGCADGFIDKNMRVAVIHMKFVERKQFFRT
jgi:hypothetical protein